MNESVQVILGYPTESCNFFALTAVNEPGSERFSSWLYQQLDSALPKGLLSNKAIGLEAYSVSAMPE